ncbi:probable G-protein coupled receptor 25 [Dromiciops gliroides]|uniref:probable G-protein coupled receptor 25 n=1 Tax=Dromiciops gliroides TaxID=33562 RepID=UPI001CC4C056|nr:probable G-protein coupled receptor 25 [Dromiciops gliroides]
MTTESWSPSPRGGDENYGWSGDYEEPEFCLTPDLPYGYIYIPLLYLAAFGAGLVGNSFVVWLLARQQGPRRLVDTFVLHLAVADLMFVVTLPFWAMAAGLSGRWTFGEDLCKISSFIIAVTRCASTLLLAGMSVDRYLAVVKLLDARPLRNQGCMLTTCAVIWTISILAGVPSLVYRKLLPMPVGPGSLCGDDPTDIFQWLSLLVLFLTFILPLFITLFCYFLISRRLCNPPHLGRGRKNSLRIIFAIVGTFTCSWLPFSTLKTFFHIAHLRALPLNCLSVMALRWGLTLSTCLAFVNSSANPIIYLLLDRSFRARAQGSCGRTHPLLTSRVSSASSLSGGDSSIFQSWALGRGRNTRVAPRFSLLPNPRGKDEEAGTPRADRGLEAAQTGASEPEEASGQVPLNRLSGLPQPGQQRKNDAVGPLDRVIAAFCSIRFRRAHRCPSAVEKS